MSSVRAVYPAPEPSDVIWENMSHSDDRKACRRRLLCVLLTLAYMASVFGLLSGIKRSVKNGLVMSLLTALATLALQEFVRRLTWRIERPCASTRYHASVAVLTLAGCAVTGAAVPVFAVLHTRGGIGSHETWYGEDGIASFVAHQLVTNASLAVLMDALVDTMLPWLFSHVLRRPRPEWPCCGLLQRCLPAAGSFRELCEIHEGPEFYLGPNIGYACFTVTFALASAAILPAAPLLVAFGLAMWYLKEKWLLLELCRRPLLISPHVALRGPDILAYGLALAPLVATLGLVPLSPPAFCTQWYFFGLGSCSMQMDTRGALTRLGIEAAIFANAAVHGPQLLRLLAQKLACCGCCGRGGSDRRRRWRICCRRLGRLGSRSCRVVLWLLTALFSWLAAYWRGGVGLLETVELPFGTITLFTSSVRDTLMVIYDITVLTLVCLGCLGFLCRIFGGPSTTASLDDYEAEPEGRARDEALFESYAAVSPFHAVQLPGNGRRCGVNGALGRSNGTSTNGAATSSCATLEGLRAWLQAPAYRAPTANGVA